MLKLFKRHPYLLGFCVLTAAFSGPGQTYFVSLYVPSLRAELGLSRVQIAALYSAATVLAACLIPVLGRGLDRWPVKPFSTLLGFGVAAGCALLGRAQGAVLVFAAFAMLRLFGQSGLSITAVTTASRSFHKSRGKALGLTSIGFPLAEMIFPFLAAVMLETWGWRKTTMSVAFFVLACYLPLSRYLLSRGRAEDEKEEAPEKTAGAAQYSWPLNDVLRNHRFYCFLAVMFVPPYMFTGILFHQGTLLESKGWPLAALPPALFCFGLMRALLSAGIGPVIDRFTARALYGFHLLAAGLGFGLLAAGTHPAAASGALALFGATVGMGGPIRAALFAEIYGTRHLGSINGVGTSFVVFATAAAPLTFGLALDAGAAFNDLLVLGVATAGVCWGIGRIGCRTTGTREALRPSP